MVTAIAQASGFQSGGIGRCCRGQWDWFRVGLLVVGGEAAALERCGGDRVAGGARY